MSLRIATLSFIDLSAAYVFFPGTYVDESESTRAEERMSIH